MEVASGYLVIKMIHIGCAAVSIAGFFIRGLLKLAGSTWLQRRWLKITPHVIDSVLLLSAVYLVINSHQYPVQSGWINAKIIALLIYIGMGFVVMRLGKTTTQQQLAFIIALLSAAYIVAVAISRNPFPF